MAARSGYLYYRQHRKIRERRPPLPCWRRTSSHSKKSLPISPRLWPPSRLSWIVSTLRSMVKIRYFTSLIGPKFPYRAPHKGRTDYICLVVYITDHNPQEDMTLIHASVLSFKITVCHHSIKVIVRSRVLNWVVTPTHLWWEGMHTSHPTL